MCAEIRLGAQWPVQRKENVIHDFLAPSKLLGLSIMSLQLFRGGTSMTPENNKMRKREAKKKKKKKKSKSSKTRECCKRRMLCSSTGFEGVALFSTMGSSFPAASSEVAHCRAVMLYLNKHNTVNWGIFLSWTHGRETYQRRAMLFLMVRVFVL